MNAGRRASCVCLLGVLTLASCGPKPEPTSPQPKSGLLPGEVPGEDPGTPWSKCYEMFAGSGDPATDVGNLGRFCGVKNKQRPVTGVRHGQQSEHDAVDRFSFSAGGKGKCYRIFGAAESGVRDLDIQVLSPEGQPLASDGSKDAYPIVPPREPLCLEQEGIYSVEVSVFHGSGRYAIQVWGN